MVKDSKVYWLAIESDTVTEGEKKKKWNEWGEN